MSDTMRLAFAVISAIIGVSIVAVIVSRNAATTSVIQSASSGFSQILGTAVSPITGNYAASGAAGFGGFSPSSITGNLGAFMNGANFGGLIP